MTRVLFACWPFEGHVFPQISIALALRERGVDVGFYSGERAREPLSSVGLPLFPLRRTENAWKRVHERESGTTGRRQSVRVQHEAGNWLVESIPSQVADLHDVIAAFEADAIVADASMWGPGLVMHEASRIPVAVASPVIYAAIPGPGAPPPGGRMGLPRTARERAQAAALIRIADLVARGIRRRVNAIRADHGLDPMRGSIAHRLGDLPLYLVASLPELDLHRQDLPAGVKYVGPLLWHPPEPPGTEEWLAGLPADRPWVHVTEGTSHYQDPFVLRSAAVGLAGAPYEAILTTGNRRGVEAITPGGPNVHVREWLGHDTLLPRCSALVTTGGAGTTMAGLRAGLPLILVPTSWDKPDIALRMVEAGLAVLVRARRCTPQALREAVDEALGDPRYRENARRIAEQLAAAPGPAGAADHIEALVNGASPPAQPLPAFEGSVHG